MECHARSTLSGSVDVDGVNIMASVVEEQKFGFPLRNLGIEIVANVLK